MATALQRILLPVGAVLSVAVVLSLVGSVAETVESTSESKNLTRLPAVGGSETFEPVARPPGGNMWIADDEDLDELEPLARAAPPNFGADFATKTEMAGWIQSMVMGDDPFSLQVLTCRERFHRAVGKDCLGRIEGVLRRELDGSGRVVYVKALAGSTSTCQAYVECIGQAWADRRGPYPSGYDDVTPFASGVSLTAGLGVESAELVSRLESSAERLERSAALRRERLDGAESQSDARRGRQQYQLAMDEAAAVDARLTALALPGGESGQ